MNTRRYQAYLDAKAQIIRELDRLRSEKIYLTIHINKCGRRGHYARKSRYELSLVDQHIDVLLLELSGVMKELVPSKSIVDG